MERKKLKEYRQSLGKTQSEMARMLDITLSFYGKIELGLKNPSINTLKKFKKVFPTADTDNIFLN